MPADIVLDAICAHHHGQGVPANQAFDASLEFLIAGKKRLQTRRKRVRVRRVRAERQVDAVDRRVRAKPFENFRSHFRAAGFENGIERFQPLLNLYVVNRVLRPNSRLVRRLGI